MQMLSELIKQYPATGTALKYALQDLKPFYAWFYPMDLRKDFVRNLRHMLPKEVHEYIWVGDIDGISFQGQPLVMWISLDYSDQLRGRKYPVVAEVDTWLYAERAKHWETSVRSSLYTANLRHFDRYAEEDLNTIFPYLKRMPDLSGEPLPQSASQGKT